MRSVASSSTIIPTTMRRILITGGAGQLGQAIYIKSEGSANRYIIATHSDVDICDGEDVERYIADHEIDIVVNCAAYTDVEGAEEHPERAMAINSDAVAVLAEVCQKHAVRLVHISTDYVFGGDSERRLPYREDDTPQPINAYGRSKARGESAVLAMRGGIVLRTSWLYAPWGKNFLLSILRLARERRELSVVDDQRGTPTSALGLAEAIVGMIDSSAIDDMSGIYHYCDAGECTWYDFARAIVEEAGIEGCNISPITSRERSMKAARPAYSALECSRIRDISAVAILPWRERLGEVMDMINKAL